jgi:hypothetical protein
MGSAGPLLPAAVSRTQNGFPEPSSQGPLTAARGAFTAPYLPETPSTPAAHAAPPQVQRATGGQPSRDLYIAAAAESAAADAVAAGVASRGSDGALVFRSPEAAAPPVPPAPTPPPAPLSAPVPVQRVTATAPATQAQQDPLPPDLDELAMRLYPRLRPYLRKDLWLDRERSGMLADLR